MRKNRFLTSSGIEIRPVYTAADLAAFDPDTELGTPGRYPFTRGIYPEMYRDRLWTMRQYAGFGTAEDSNERYRFLLAQGQTGLSVAFDLPTQLGLDSDHPQSRGEVGKVGVAIDSVHDLDRLFQGIPLGRVSVSMTINATAAAILAMYLAVARRRRVPWSRLSGTIQNDILKEYIARGTYIYPPEPSLRLITDVFSFCHARVPKWNTISISGYHIREAGATAAQELAFTLADAVAYVEAALKAGLGIDDFAPRLSFFLASHNYFFEEIAKFRAGRRIWARLMRERFRAAQPESWAFRFHTQTSGVTLVAREPDNNVVRVSLQALAAVLGGTQSLHTDSRDEALALPSEESARIALRTQQIIADESGVAETVDPVGGSYYLEALTSAIERKALEYLEKIEALGGMLRAISQGFVQAEIQESAFEAQKKIESREQIVVGLNEFGEGAGRPQFELYYPPRRLERSQVEKLRRLRRSRSDRKVRAALAALMNAAESGENLLPFMVTAAAGEATLGEISDALRAVFGTHQEAIVI